MPTDNLIDPMSKLHAIALLLAACSLVSGCQKPTGSASAASSAAPAAPLGKTTATPAAPAPVVASKTYDGPFGLAASMPVAELTRLDFKPMESNSTIYTGIAPKPMEGIDDYAVLATPETGVCRIMANTNISVVNGSGDQIKERVDQLAELVATKYGKHSSKIDFVGEDVYRRNPEYWMMALKEDSAVYGYTWKTGKTATALPEDVDRIEISAGAVRTDGGWAQIRYTFKNIDACNSDNKKRKAASL